MRKDKVNSLEALSNIVRKWKINQTLLAEKMEMSKTTFIKSLNEEKYYNFSPQQISKLKSILAELRTDLERV